MVDCWYYIAVLDLFFFIHLLIAPKFLKKWIYHRNMYTTKTPINVVKYSTFSQYYGNNYETCVPFPTKIINLIINAVKYVTSSKTNWIYLKVSECRKRIIFNKVNNKADNCLVLNNVIKSNLWERVQPSPYLNKIASCTSYFHLRFALKCIWILCKCTEMD